MAHVAPHAGPTAPRRTAGTHAGIDTWAAPLLGVGYGLWAALIHRSGGPITTANVLYGVVTAVAFAALWYGLRKVSTRLPREQRALAWFTFTGVAFGYLYSLTGASVLRAIIMASLIAGAAALVLFYRYYTHED